MARVPPWRVSFDPKARVYRHSVEAGFGHALLAPLVANTFETIGLGVTFWDGREWLPLRTEVQSITRFEFEHGFNPERVAYNERHFALAKRRKKAVRGTHAGYSDFFVPVVADHSLLGVLVAGPFATARPTAASVLDRWRWLTGRQGQMTDPEFDWYLRASLSVLVLDKKKDAVLRQILECLAGLMAGRESAEALANQAYVLRAELEKARQPERMWAAARRMLDDRAQRALFDAVHTYELSNLGLSRETDHVVVGLTASGKVESSSVKDAILRDAFQRASVQLALSARDAMAGKVGDHGVFFLSGASGSTARKRQRALDLAERATALGRRFGITLHCGISAVPESASLARSYQSALTAAEIALARKTRTQLADPATDRPGHGLRHLREELAKLVEERPELFAARAERYIEAVVMSSGRRLEPAQAHLEVGFERITQALVQSGALDERSFVRMRDGLDRASAAAQTVDELVSAYRRSISDLTRAVEQPVEARQDRSLQAALDYIHEHFSGPVRLSKVARIVGLSANHFSKLFIKRERVPFEQYVSRLRVDRAKHLLAGTELEVVRVAELSGFNSAPYFCRVFRRATGSTPLGFRRQAPEVREAPRIKVQAQTR
jgi:AraC-like DNA-binding protein